MNLVSFEYLACQTSKNAKGVLVLSEFAGAAQALGAGALLVNPYNVSEVARAIDESLNMPASEREERFEYLDKHIHGHTAQEGPPALHIHGHTAQEGAPALHTAAPSPRAEQPHLATKPLALLAGVGDAVRGLAAARAPSLLVRRRPLLRAVSRRDAAGPAGRRLVQGVRSPTPTVPEPIPYPHGT